MSFTGEFRHTVDVKGRLIVPSRMRDVLSGGQVILTRWLEDCIAIWSQEGWERMQDKLLAAGSASREARDFVRMVSSSAHIDEVDKQGRITVPTPLREYAGLTRDCVVIGANTHLEIWDAATWRAYEQEQEQAFAEQEEVALTS